MAATQGPFADPLQWVTISDFSPGIISNSNFAYGAAGNSDNPVPALSQGAASAAGTFNCIALPNGGLGPLPGVAAQLSMASISGSNVTDQPFVVTGTFVLGPIGYSQNFPFGGDELIMAFESLVGDTRTWVIYVYQEATGLPVELITNQVTSDQSGIPATSMVFTELNFTDPAQNGYPRVIFSHITYDNSGNIVVCAAYPAETPNASPNYTDLSDVSFGPGWLIAHQNRIVELVPVPTPWTRTPVGSATAEYFFPAEYFNYTEPPNSSTFGGQNENFVQENPTAHGAWGSISASELFLTRHQGGGYVIQGDLNAPTVTRLPGVTSTNGAVQVAAETPIGLVYGSNWNGVWAWNGANTSVKLSPQLNDNFFMPGDLPPGLEVDATSGPFFTFAVLGDLIYAPNNWVFSTTLNSWWRWDLPVNTPPQENIFTLGQSLIGGTDVLGGGQYIPGLMTWFWPTYDGQGIWSMPQYVQLGTDNAAVKLSRQTPAQSYTWQSYPMPFTQNRQVSIRQVAVRAQGAGNVTITFNNPYGQSENTLPETLSYTDADSPLIQQAQCAARGTDITMYISAEGVYGNPAPVIYSVSIGWEEAQEVNAT